jgi:hypothetical protein
MKAARPKSTQQQLFGQWLIGAKNRLSRNDPIADIALEIV